MCGTVGQSVTARGVVGALLMAMIATPWFCGVASAEPPHQKLRGSLAYIKASGQVKSGPNASETVDSFGTGFMVSTEGLILTTYHLISELGDVEPRTVTIEVRLTEKTASPRRAAIVDASIATDLLLLKISPSADPQGYPAVTLGRAQDHKDAEAIYTSGFPKSVSYITQQNLVQSRDGPGGYLWTIGMDVDAGQSGSPIYDQDAKVLGLIKGDEGALTYMIPIEFADTLLAQVRLREIQHALEDFASLRQTMSWEGALVKGRGSPKIVLTYAKIMGGLPRVDTIDLLIKPVGMRNGEKKEITDFEIGGQKRTADYGKTGGAFEINDLWERIEKYRSEFQFDSILYLNIVVISTLNDGTKLDPKRVRVGYEE